jgi:hypothetical protein
MITTLYPTVVLFPGLPPVPPAVATIYPVLIVTNDQNSNLAPEGPGCPVPPAIASLNYVNIGNEGSTYQLNGSDFTVYQSQDEAFTDIIGNYSLNGTTWTPALSATGSHFLFAEKAFPFDCVFYPQMDEYLQNTCMAWLESSPTGRLDLWYSEGAIGYSVPTFTVPATSVSSSTIYIYPRRTAIEQGVRTEGFPLSDITVTDVLGNTFVIDTNEAVSRGLEFTMPGPIYSFKYSQTFRQPLNTLVGNLTTLPTQANGFTTSPLSNVTINIYYGHTGMLYKRIVTSDKGYYSCTLRNQEYTFEIVTDNLSINVNQRLL